MDESREIRILWSIVSKAAERSRRTRADSFCWLIAIGVVGEDRFVFEEGLFLWNETCGRQIGKEKWRRMIVCVN